MCLDILQLKDSLSLLKLETFELRVCREELFLKDSDGVIALVPLAVQAIELKLLMAVTQLQFSNLFCEDFNAGDSIS